MLRQIQRDVVVLASQRQAATVVPAAGRVRVERGRRHAASDPVVARRRRLRQRRRPAVDQLRTRCRTERVQKHGRLAGELDRRRRHAHWEHGKCWNFLSGSGVFRCILFVRGPICAGNRCDGTTAAYL